MSESGDSLEPWRVGSDSEHLISAVVHALVLARNRWRETNGVDLRAFAEVGQLVVGDDGPMALDPQHQGRSASAETSRTRITRE